MTDRPEIVPTLAEAQAKLRRDMRFDSDPRWFDRQINPPAVERRVRWGYLIAWGAIMAGICLAAAYAPRAWSAERKTPGPHEITLLFPGHALDEVSRSFFTLSGPYEDWDTCDKAKRRLVV